MARHEFSKDKKFFPTLLIILINLLIMLLLCIGLGWLTIKMLDKYTRHDKVYTMPNFVGQDYREVVHDHSKDFHFILIDSVYPKGQQPGSIYQQDPLPGSKIKKGRNVYTIIVAFTPEKTKMPNLKGISLRDAIGRLESSGLEVDHLDYVNYSFKNNIVDQYYEGAHIDTGTVLIKGSKIVLKVGKGQESNNVKVPNLIGKPASDVKHILNLSGLNLGKEVNEDGDSIQYLCVRRMSPGPSSGAIKAGSYIDVWYHSSRTLDFKKNMDELLHEDSLTNNPEPIKIDTIVTDTIETTEIEYEDEF